MRRSRSCTSVTTGARGRSRNSKAARMQIFLFDLLPFDRHFDEFKAGRHMPFPLPGSYFEAETAARSYEQHLAIWEEMDRLGCDGVGLNESHTTPPRPVNSPNKIGAAGPP